MYITFQPTSIPHPESRCASTACHQTGRDVRSSCLLGQIWASPFSSELEAQDPHDASSLSLTPQTRGFLHAFHPSFPFDFPSIGWEPSCWKTDLHLFHQHRGHVPNLPRPSIGKRICLGSILTDRGEKILTVQAIHPFTWHHTYIPCLSPDLIDYLDAPTPYLVIWDLIWVTMAVI